MGQVYTYTQTVYNLVNVRSSVSSINCFSVPLADRSRSEFITVKALSSQHSLQQQQNQLFAGKNTSVCYYHLRM